MVSEYVRRLVRDYFLTDLLGWLASEYLKSMKHPIHMMTKYLWAASLLFALACQPNTDADPLAQATRDYYAALETSDLVRIGELVYDSVRVLEGEYTSVYAVADYESWLDWDSIFHPTYEILDLAVEDSVVDVEVAKRCTRITFLNNEEPLVTRERLTFREGQLFRSEILDYVEFDNEAWVARREALVAWAAKNHPELNGFIHDQTQQGGVNYLKALALYQTAQN